MNFPIKPAELIEKTKYCLEEDRLITDSSLVDTENFVMTGPVVGPLTYAQLTNALKNFNPREVFGFGFDCNYHFRVDPYIPGRVWYTSRQWSVNTGKVFGQEPNFKVADAGPENYSLTFNKEGKVIEVTVGYVQDRRLGNQGGLGGIYGRFYAIGRGLPFREAQPWKPSLSSKFFDTINGFRTWLEKLRGGTSS